MTSVARPRLRAAGLFVALAMLARPAQAEPLPHDQPLPPAELGAYVDSLVETTMARDHVAGVTVSIVQDGKVVLKRGYGMASLTPRRPVDPDRTLFRLGSISKTFTWISVMRQVEAGRMRLDAPVDLYLPPALRTGNGRFRAPIRVEDLMDHSPGFEDRAFGVLFERDPAKVRSLDAFLAETRPARVRPPGQVSSYSNYGAALAGSAVAHLAGEDFETLVDTTIIGPLGMAHTTFREARPARPGLPAPMPAALAADASAGFHWTGTGYQQRTYEYIGQTAPAGAASSTAADMARYMSMILGAGTLDGVTIYGPTAAEAFRTPVRPAPPGLAWRHGFYDQPLPGGLMGFGHNGGTVSFLSNMTLVPDLRLGVFVSTNSDTGGRLQAAIAPAVIKHFYVAADPYPPAADPRLATMGARYDGHYLSTRRAHSGLEAFVGRFAFGSDVAVSPDGKLILSGLFGQQAFVPDGDPAAGRFVSVETGQPLIFAIQNGRATGILQGGATLERTGPLDSPPLLQAFGAGALLAALATLLGLAARPLRSPASRAQRWAGGLQAAQAVCWLVGLGGFLAVLQGATDQSRLLYDWPSPGILAASVGALGAALLTLATLPMLPAVWRGDGWTWRRKAAFTVTALLSLGFAAILLRWGLLTPWAP